MSRIVGYDVTYGTYVPWVGHATSAVIIRRKLCFERRYNLNSDDLAETLIQVISWWPQSNLIDHKLVQIFGIPFRFIPFHCVSLRFIPFPIDQRSYSSLLTWYLNESRSQRTCPIHNEFQLVLPGAESSANFSQFWLISISNSYAIGTAPLLFEAAGHSMFNTPYKTIIKICVISRAPGGRVVSASDWHERGL